MDKHNRTHLAKPGQFEQKWFLIDLKDQVLGRAATQIANILRGKHKPIYTPHVDTGDFVIVINAGQVKLTGKKWSDKIYSRHTGYIGGLKESSASELVERHPEDLIYLAVKRMIPATRLGRQMIKKLKIYAGDQHPHTAQTPEPYTLCN